MTISQPQPVRLTRRRALAGAAWSAPAIVVASAVPAFAVSPTTSLSLNRGGTSVMTTNNGTDSFYDLNFLGLSVVVPSALAAGQLTLTVTFTPATPGGPSTLLVLDEPPAASGFTISPAATMTAASVLLSYGPAVPAGSEIQVPNGFFVGANDSTATQTGQYVVTATAPGLTSDAESFATPATRASRGNAGIPRPLV